MKFIDEVVITVESGRGGAGCISFWRAKGLPRGGPDGGDGGKGGDVIFEITHNINSLLDYRWHKVYKAHNGEEGKAMRKAGSDGNDIILRVPPGTVIKDAETEEMILDLGEELRRVTFLSGGRGGKGNDFFKTSVNQAPHHAQPGEEGKARLVKLELKLLADVGIIGFPNAGKSTLISKISAARPKIADYPFTTLTPNLGVVRFNEEQNFVVADIPGLVPGAHQGVGLGIKFLKHIQRTRLFVHLIDASEMSGRDPWEDYQALQDELAAYDKLSQGEEEYFSPLANRPQIVVLNKLDIISEKDQKKVLDKFRKKNVDPQIISSATGTGIQDLINEMGRMVFNGNKETPN